MFTNVYRLSTGTCLLHQRHFGVVFARLLCSAGITNENEFKFSGSPTPRVSNDVTFGHAHTLCSQYNRAYLVNKGCLHSVEWNGGME